MKKALSLILCLIMIFTVLPVSFAMTASEAMALKPKGLILSGSGEDALDGLDFELLNLNVPVLALGGAAVDGYTHTHLSAEDIERNELPRLHHIAMGLPIHEDEGYGQYGEGGWLIFSTSFEDPQERREALMREVIDRVYYLRVPSRLIHMMSRKLISTFGDGTFLLNEIIQADTPQPDNAVKQVIFETGRFYPAYYHLCTAMFVSQMIIACLACAQAVWKRRTDAAPVFIALVGIFLVLCMWETRGRYFFQYQPVLLMAAAMLETKRAAARRDD